jgi:hypothetical protein
MHSIVRPIYEKLDVSLPERLDSGMALWTVLDGDVRSDALCCVNPATNDSRDLRLPIDDCPEEIAGHSVLTVAGNVNPEVLEIPIRVIIRENFGGHLEGWIRTWTTDLSEFTEKSLFEDHKREESIEWSGTKQTIDPEKIKNRQNIFRESDVRGSKNELIK